MRWYKVILKGIDEINAVLFISISFHCIVHVLDPPMKESWIFCQDWAIGLSGENAVKQYDILEIDDSSHYLM